MQVLCVYACVHNAILDKTDTQPTSLIIRYATHAKKKHRYSVFFIVFVGGALGCVPPMESRGRLPDMTQILINRRLHPSIIVRFCRLCHRQQI